jgi:alpha-beta hydrolase superfamily lysophospholipase/SAM-dependent methyltransferase
MTTTVWPGAQTEHTLRLPDGAELFYRAWLPQTPTDQAVVLFHRGHEHSGRLADVVEALDLPDVAMFAWDARGHGRSPGDRGYAPSFATLVDDADCFIRHIGQTHQIPIENIVVLAHSVGGVIAATWVHDYAPRIRALVLATPALRVKLYLPLAIPALRLFHWLKGNRKSFIKSYVKAGMLTHDAEQARRYDEDPLIARSIAVNILLQMHDAATRLMEDAGAIRVPTLLLTGGSDWVVHRSAQQRFFQRLGSPIRQMRTFPGMYHDVLHEKDRQVVIAEARQFIQEAFARNLRPPPLLDADVRGYTREEYDRLTLPLTPLSPRWFNYSLQRLATSTVGRLSRGVRLGWQTGFDSGQSLDYVYENRPQGTAGIGKLIDKLYLESIGWRGIRQRKVNLEALLREAIDRVQKEGQPVRLLDVATGCGRYILDTIKSLPQVEISALLRDYTPANLEAGRRLAQEMGLAGVRFEQGDAFDEESLATIAPAPNVAVVSGLYELFPDNKLVSRSLRGIARSMREEGYLIYTGQPWHPQVEMIARVLINRDGRPWIMRRRTTEEMDDLVRAAGFEKLAMKIDEYGIFTVSLARRR